MKKILSYIYICLYWYLVRHSHYCTSHHLTRDVFFCKTVFRLISATVFITSCLIIGWMKSITSDIYSWFLTFSTFTLPNIGCCTVICFEIFGHFSPHLFFSCSWLKFHSCWDYYLYRRNRFSLLFSLSCSLLSSLLNLPSKAWESFWLQKDISSSHPWLAPCQCRVSLFFHSVPLGLSYQSAWPDYQAVGSQSTGSSDPSISAV